MFFVSKKTFKSSINEINERKIQPHKPIAKFVSYQRGVYYANIRILNALTMRIASQVMNKMCFIKNAKTFLLDKSLYSSEECFNLYTRDEN